MFRLWFSARNFYLFLGALQEWDGAQLLAQRHELPLRGRSLGGVAHNAGVQHQVGRLFNG